MATQLELVEKQPRDIFQELGSTGLKRWGGTLDEEFLRDLRGAKAVKVYREMSMNDPIIGAMLFAIEMLIRQVSWRVEPFSEDTEDQERATFLSQNFFEDMSTSWADTIAEILSFLIYGYSWHETVYKVRGGDVRDPTKRSKFTDGLIGIRKLPIRAQDSLYEWQFDEEGGVQAMVQQPAPDYQLRTIPIEKSLLFRTTVQKGSPEGISVLRRAYTPYYYGKHIQTIEAIGIERDLAGLPVAWVPSALLSSTNATDLANLNKIKDLVTSIKRDEQEGIIFPLVYDKDGRKLYDLTLLTTGGRRQFDTEAVVQRYDQRKAVTLLADFILLGARREGSFALSSNKTALFATAIGAWADEIAEVFNRHLTPRLWRLNGWPTDRLPQLHHGDIEGPDLKELGEYVQKLAGAGFPLFPNEQLEHMLLEAAHLPAPVVEEQV